MDEMETMDVGAADDAPVTDDAPATGSAGDSVITDDASDTEAADDSSDESPAKKAAPKKPASRKRKVTRGGAETEVDLDDEETLLKLLSDEPEWEAKVNGQSRRVRREDALKDYELREASHERMREAARQRQQLEEWKQTLRNDRAKLREFLTDELGYDNPYEPLEEEYYQQIELEELSRTNPTEFARRVAERTRAEEQAKWKRQQAAQQAQQQKAVREQQALQFRQALPKALEKHGLRGDDATVGILRQINQRLRSAGQNPTPDDLAYEARRVVGELVRGQLPTDPDQLAEFLGEDVLKALRARDVKMTQAKQRQAASKAKPKASGGGRPLSAKEFLEKYG